MSSLLFSVVRSVGPCSCQWTGRVTGGLAGTDVLTQSTCSWLVACSLKVEGLTSPFLETKTETAKSHGFPPVGPYQGKNVAEVIRLRYSMIYVLPKIHAHNRWHLFLGNFNMLKLHIILFGLSCK